MARRWPTILSLLVSALALGCPPAWAQAGRAAHQPAAGGLADPVPVRVPDRVWSTRPAPPPAASHSGGVVVMTPNVVLGWGGLPPSGPVVQVAPGGPVRPGGWQPGPASVRRHPSGVVVPVPGVPGPVHGVPAGPATLHQWRSP